MKKLILTVATLVLLGCSKPDVWTAFVFPDIESMPGPADSERYQVGHFDSFEACQVASVGQVRERLEKSGKQGAYVCGLNCARNQKFGNFLVCSENRK